MPPAAQVAPAPVTWVRGVAPLAAVLSHLTAITNGFTWLDHGDLEAGAALVPPAQWLALLTHGFGRTGFYRPLTALSLSLDGLHGAPWVFHLSSVLLHALAALALAEAAEALGVSRKAAVLGAVLFAVHPLTALVVDQVSFRADLLVAVALFTLVAAHRADRPLLAGLALLAGALSKETGLVLGPLFVIALTFDRRPARQLIVAELLGFAGASALRVAFAPTWRGQQPPLSLTEGLGTRLAGIAKSAWAVVGPSSPCDALAITQPWQPWALAGVAVAAALVLAARREPVGWLMLCAALPSLNLVAAPRFWSVHYLYLPWAFAAVLLAQRAAGSRWAWRAGLALAALLGVASLAEGARFLDDEALFAADAGRAECREAHLYLGDARRLRGDLEGAARQYLLAAAPAPGFLAYSDEAAALQNLGLVRLQQAQFFEAELALQQALEKTAEPATRAEVTHDLAAVAVARGDPAGAVKLLEPLVAARGAQAASMRLLARALSEMGRVDEAKAWLQRAETAR